MYFAEFEKFYSLEIGKPLNKMCQDKEIMLKNQIMIRKNSFI